MFIVRLFGARPRWGLGKWKRIRPSSCPQGARSLAEEPHRTPLVLSGGLDRGAGRCLSQNSESRLWARAGGGFPEEVALNPGLERREGIRCF